MVNSESGCFPKHPYLCSLRKSPVAFININKCRTPRTFPCSRCFYYHLLLSCLSFLLLYKKGSLTKALFYFKIF
ncbi:hypothetical protein GM58_08300 [Listeria monocytogenes]|nr:hypothetical protein [Listeria monocytogenes]EAC9523150.1 hypothetical protein [Listeria monocytogenes]EAD0075434.1 hypothetical protein [Listeria monocytogenes]EAD1770184.1 hypothetical protein [Listeria monocytogenes]EAD5205780.1 hypothetical protein [Listeria monocytogenes]